MKDRIKAMVDRFTRDFANDPERVQSLLETLGDLQARKKDVGRQVDQIMARANVATQGDLEEALRRVNRLRRRCKQLVRTVQRHNRRRAKAQEN